MLTRTWVWPILNTTGCSTRIWCRSVMWLNMTRFSRASVTVGGRQEGEIAPNFQQRRRRGRTGGLRKDRVEREEILLEFGDGRKGDRTARVEPLERDDAVELAEVALEERVGSEDEDPLHVLVDGGGEDGDELDDPLSGNLV